MNLRSLFTKAPHAWLLLFTQVVFILLYAFLVDYDAKISSSKTSNSYPMFQDIHIMVLVGFGFLMTFLKRYGKSALGFTLLLAALSFQWAILLGALLNKTSAGKAQLGLKNLVSGDFAAASVLISFGAVIGLASPAQLLIMTIAELPLYTVNEYIATKILKVSDVGGSMTIHVFGAYFGLAVSFMLMLRRSKELKAGMSNNISTDESDITAMIGTLFLWICWPSFNAVSVEAQAGQNRAVINTYLALTASTVGAFVVSSLTERDGRFTMVHVQNATLAGGVAIGTSANYMLFPFGALIVGFVAGVLSVLGFRFLSPRFPIHDTCGVHNLHGFIGIFAAIVGAVGAALANEATYGDELYTIFPACAPKLTTVGFVDMHQNLAAEILEAGEGRSFGKQAGFQFAAVCMTLAIAIGGGLITGLLLRLRIFRQLPSDVMFEDFAYWHSPTSQTEQMDKAAKSLLKQMNGTQDDEPKAPKIITVKQVQVSAIATDM